MFTDASASVSAATVLDPPPATPRAAATPHGGATGPRTEQGKAASARNATTHGLFARDVVLPALGEDPESYRRLEDAWLAQLPPHSLLEQHYVEKIAAASWRLRRLQRWQAQIFEDDALTEPERLARLDSALRHENQLHRQIDTAVKMLNKDVPQLYTRRVRDEVLLDMLVSERECRESAREETEIDLETRGRLRRIRKATEAAVDALRPAPTDTAPAAAPAADRDENCQNEPLTWESDAEETDEEYTRGPENTQAQADAEDDVAAWWAAGSTPPGAATEQNSRNEPRPRTSDGRFSPFPLFAPSVSDTPLPLAGALLGGVGASKEPGSGPNAVASSRSSPSLTRGGSALAPGRGPRRGEVTAR